MDITKLAIDVGFDELSVVEHYSMFLQFAQAVLRIDNDFYNAVIDELVVCGIYSKEHDSNPRKAIQDIIEWNCDVALDPAVSSDAQALIQRGAAVEREACAKIAWNHETEDFGPIETAIRARKDILIDTQSIDYNEDDINF